MVLNNLIPVNCQQPVNISIKGKVISGASANNTLLTSDELQLDFDGATVFPGLINAHDHLDFNCFPILGQSTYLNYAEWGKHIHREYKKEISKVLKIPVELRAAWGMYKNLLAGVTTVVNHGDQLKIDHPLISVHQDFQSLHSVKFQKNWKWKLNNPITKKQVCMIHAGEGTDNASSKEIDKLIRWNLWNRELIAVHGVAMNPAQAKKFMGLAWCPESNMVLLGQTADVSLLKEHTRIVFGTDSTLTGNWNIWHHLRLARKTKQVSDEELFKMTTATAAELFNTHGGSIRQGKKADLVITKNPGSDRSWDSFFKTNPEDILLMIHRGKIRLFDEKYYPVLKQLNFDTKRFSAIMINGEKKFVEGDIPFLMASIRRYYPEAVFPCERYEQTKIAANG